MSSLTIRLDSKTESQLEHLALISKQSKSAIARTGILEYLENQQHHENNKKSYTKKMTVSSISEVRERVALAEQSELVSDEEYEQKMEQFFKQELGLIR